MKQGPERELAARYLERAVAAGRPLALTGFEVVEHPESRAGSTAARRAEEARALAAAIPADALTVVLDEHGRSLSSEAFATMIAGWRDAGRSAVALVIGYVMRLQGKIKTN